jgi:hypothetical protein
MTTNRQFSQNDETFRTWCGRANIPPTPRQASKFRNKEGFVYRFMRENEPSLDSAADGNISN